MERGGVSSRNSDGQIMSEDVEVRQRWNWEIETTEGVVEVLCEVFGDDTLRIEWRARGSEKTQAYPNCAGLRVDTVDMKEEELQKMIETLKELWGGDMPQEAKDCCVEELMRLRRVGRQERELQETHHKEEMERRRTLGETEAASVISGD
jgi:hypothetical protein